MRIAPKDKPFLLTLVVLCVLLLLIFLALLVPHQEASTEIAKNNAGQNQPDLFDWLAKDSISLFTVVLALLTGALVYIGYAQQELTAALERPWLFIESVKMTNLAPGITLPPRMHFRLANPGRTHARILGLRGGVRARAKEMVINPDDVRLNDAPLDAAYALTVHPGKTGSETVARLDQIKDRGRTMIADGSAVLIARGVFVYAGARGEIHETAFCMKYDHATQTFEGFGGVEYNYQT